MTHFILAVDTYPDMHEKFVKWLRHGDKKKYPNNPTEWGIKVREIKLYDVVMTKNWKEPFLRDMVYFEGGGNIWQGRSLRKIVNMIIKMFKLPFNPIKLPPEGPSQAEIESHGPLDGFWAEVLTIVEMPDSDVDGREGL